MILGRTRERLVEDVLKLFKKNLSLNGSSPSISTIARKNESNLVVSILGFVHFLPDKSQLTMLVGGY